MQFVPACVGEPNDALSLCAGDPYGLDECGQQVSAKASGEVVLLL